MKKYNYRDLYDEYADLNEEERIAKLKEAIASIDAFLLKNHDEAYCKRFLLRLFSAFIGKDLNVNKKELKMFNAIIGKNYDIIELASLVKDNVSEKQINDLMDEIKGFDEVSKDQIIVFGLLVVVEDGKVTYEENEFLEQLAKLF